MYCALLQAIKTNQSLLQMLTGHLENSAGCILAVECNMNFSTEAVDL